MEPRAVAILDSRRIRAELDRLGLTQVEFARRIGLRQSTISQALHDKPLATETVYRIALGLSLVEPVK